MDCSVVNTLICIVLRYEYANILSTHLHYILRDCRTLWTNSISLLQMYVKVCYLYFDKHIGINADISEIPKLFVVYIFDAMWYNDTMRWEWCSCQSNEQF